MRAVVATTLGALLTAFCADVASAQAPAEPALRIESVDIDGYPTVEAVVSAPSGLADVEAAFEIREDGEPRTVEVGHAETADLHVSLLIDITGSMVGAALEAAKDAATAFVDSLPADVNVSVLAYDTDVTVVTDFGASHAEHRAGIAALAADGETAMYDAVATALDRFPDEENSSRALVLLTDGEDNASETAIEEVVGRLSEEQVLLRGVEYQTAYSESAGTAAMAAATGGSVSQADDPAALVGLYEQLAADLVNRYTLRYESDAAGAVELEFVLPTDDAVLTASRTLELPVPPIDQAEVEPVQPPTPVERRDATAPWSLLVGAGSWFVALVLLSWPLLSPRERRAQIAGAGRHQGPGVATGLSAQVTAIASRTLSSRGYERGLNAALERAGISLRPEEFVVLAGSAVLTASFVGLLLHGILVAFVSAAIAAVAARIVVTFRTGRRQRRFAEQLSDTLQLLSGSLRAGYSLMQAIDAVAREADAPASEEFGRLVVETRLGRDTRDALHALAARMGGEDLSWVVQAIEIHREVGGDLAEVLDTVAGTIRERDQIRRQVKALSAEGRLSAWVLLALPFGVGGTIFLTNRPYLAELPNGGLLGWGFMVTGAVLMTAGIFWLRHLVKIEF